MLARIKRLCKEANLPVSRFEQLINIAPNSLSRWDKNMPSIDKVVRAADYFGVSLDYIYGRDDYLSNGDGGLNLSHTESDIIKKARNLDENGRETVLYIIDSELRRMEEIASERQNSANIIPLWRSV